METETRESVVANLSELIKRKPIRRTMTYTGRWKLESFPTQWIIPRREHLVLNILRKKPLNEYEVWTKAQQARPPLGWDEVHQAIHDLATNGHIVRVKEE